MSTSIDNSSIVTTPQPLSQLELFVRRYAEQAGGGYEQIEPQVYDLLLDEGLVRVSFDPEALHEHTEAQFVSLGSPLLNSIIENASARGATAIAYHQGLNLHPHNIEGRLRRQYVLPPNTTLEIHRVRPMYFPQCVCWFEFTFESDQREQELLQVAIDLATGRELRQTDRLLDHSRLSEQTLEPLPIARCKPLREGCLLAANQAIRTASALANARRRELNDRLANLSARMNAYYDQMLRELEDRTVKDDAGKQKLESRRTSIEQERRLRLAEAHRKHSLQVSMRPVNLLLVFVPKLQFIASWMGPRRKLADLLPVFDPLVDAFEPIDCPSCHRPTLQLQLKSADRIVCPQCG